MAQKIGLALIAIFGLVNGEIYAPSNHHILVSAPPLVTFKRKSNRDEDSSHGHGKQLGQHHIQLGVLDFANALGHPTESNDGHHEDQKRSGSSGRRSNASFDRLRKVSPLKKRIDVSPPVIKIVRQSSVGKRREVSVDSKREASTGKRGKVAVPVFSNLRYVDNDKHGQFEKAPITIVTAPLISTAEIKDHKVGLNKVAGKTNCPQCIEENHQAKLTKKSAGKAIQRYDELLKTKIQAPIKNVEAHDDEQSSDGISKPRVQKYKGAKINKDKLIHQLVQGEINKQRPLVVGSVVIAESKGHTHDHEQHEHGDCQEHHHGYHNDHDHRHNHD